MTFDPFRLAEAAKELDDAATEDEWRAAVLAAWESLCLGRFGAHVRRNEPWENAIVEEAGKFLADSRLGRPTGPVLDSWERIVDVASRGASCAPDGMVQCYAPAGHSGGLRLPISSLHRAKRSG